MRQKVRIRNRNCLRRGKKRILSLLIAALLSCVAAFTACLDAACAQAQPLTELPFEISAPSAILMEASTGQVIYEKGADEERSPASITKIMTLLLIFDAIHSGKIALTDEVTTSAYAQSMGGSQVFLEEGEVQTVETLIKCIVVASGNDASVAMAEYISGSEEAFVAQMNARAAELGMEHTHFEDCCGLSNSDGHYTSARDVALMARELITKYPEIYQYTTIWMEDITHVTRRGESVFTLSSTNKLLKQYEWTTGLKTGSTNKAKYCFCGTARKNDIDLIAVVMAAPDFRVRFDDARKLLEHGYSLCAVYTDTNEEGLADIELSGGVADTVPLRVEDAFSYLDLTGADLSAVTKELRVPPAMAPVTEGKKAGEIVYLLGGRQIGSVDVLYGASVKKATFRDYLGRIWKRYLI
ncbi:MAG: D-alanyl-D-alanine carboxypeptidase [Lachnospiraceae bacterium]|nr:D-alanyl-D-alanine carboxypeptidase [Lachnospiraceae bacterium]